MASSAAVAPGVGIRIRRMRPEDHPISGQDQTATNVTDAGRERRREGIEVFHEPATSFSTIGRHGGTLERRPTGAGRMALRAEG